MQIILAGKGDTWCFGDSVTLALQSGNFVNQSSSNINSIETSASISDSISNLLFYCGGYTNNTVWLHKCLERQSSINSKWNSILGDGTITNGFYYSIPVRQCKYYIFFNWLCQVLYYSVVDMSLNSGNGAVTQKTCYFITLHLYQKNLLASNTVTGVIGG